MMRSRLIVQHAPKSESANFFEKLWVMMSPCGGAMNWEIIVLILGEKGDLQPIQYANQIAL